MTLNLKDLRDACMGASESEICEYAAGLGYDEMQQALPYLADYGVDENDIMRWIYFSLK